MIKSKNVAAENIQLQLSTPPYPVNKSGNKTSVAQHVESSCSHTSRGGVPSITTQNNEDFYMISEGYMNDTDSFISEDEAELVYEEIDRKSYVIPEADGQQTARASGRDAGPTGNSCHFVPDKEQLYTNDLVATDQVSQSTNGHQRNPTATVNARNKNVHPSWT